MPITTTTPIDICNLALGHLGKPSIVSFTEGSKEANLCNAQYDISRRMALVRAPWTFARRTVVLAELEVNVHEISWEFAYDVPNNSLKIVRLLEPGQVPNWNARPQDMYLEAGSVYCHVPEARLAHIFNNEDVGSWSPLFCDAVALLLAKRMAPQATRRPSDVKELHTAYEEMLSLASEVDAQQEVTFYRYGDGYADSRDTGTGSGRRQADGSRIWEE